MQSPRKFSEVSQIVFGGEAYWNFEGMGTRLFEHSRRLVFSDNSEIVLRSQQYNALLLLLTRQREPVVTKQAFIEHLWQGNPGVNEHGLQSLIAELRIILKSEDLIQT